MGGDQSKSNLDNSNSNDSCEGDQSVEDTETTSEILWRKKVFEIENGVEHFKEKFQLLDTKVRLLKSENDKLKTHVSVLNSKVESLEIGMKEAKKETNWMMIEKSDLEERTKRLESQERPVPPFKNVQLPDSACLNPLFQAKTSFSNKLITTKIPFSLYDISGTIVKKKVSSKTEKIHITPQSLINVPASSPSAPASWFPKCAKGIPHQILSQFKQNKCELCDITLHHESVARNHYKGKKHLKNLNKVYPIKEVENITPDVYTESWFFFFSQTLSPDLLTQCKLNICELCKVSLDSDAQARIHYKSERHEQKIKQFQTKTPPTTSKQSSINPADDIFCDEEILYNDELVVLSDNTKEVITVCDQNKVFIGCNFCDNGEVHSVILLNSEGQEVFEEVVPSSDTEEKNVSEASQDIENEEKECEKFQSRLKEILSDNILVGYDLGKKLKALKLDHPQHLTRDTSFKFSGLAPGSKLSLDILANKLLNISDFQSDQINEALISLEIFKKMSYQEDKLKRIRNVECRLLMSKSVMAVLRKGRKRKKLTKLNKDGVGLDVPLVGSVVSVFGSEVEPVGSTLLNLLEMINYNQLETQLKLIVPTRLQVKRTDLVSSSNPPMVTMFSRLLPNSREKIVTFEGDVFAMVTGVSQCLNLMEQKGCGYGGPGIRYDCSDHDDLTADLYGGWIGDGDEDGTTDSCSSCLGMFGVEHFSWSQIGKGENRTCYSCVSL